MIKIKNGKNMIKKQYIIILFIILAIPQNIYPIIRHGLDFNVNVPIGMGIMIPHGSIPQYKPSGNEVNFQGGVGIGLGYYLGISDLVSMSFLATFSYSYNKTSIHKDNVNINYIYESSSLTFGGMPKVYIGNFSLGLDIGIRLPVTPALTIQYKGKDYTSNKPGTPRTYLKFVADYNIFFREDMAIAIGLYLGYDWGFNLNNIDLPDITKGEAYGNLDLGIQIAYRYASFFR
ncbi:hypothetical protein A966_07789 [Brachyspira hampsonii 30446]|uniref:Outer membrane protein beta-barrel domain-containing protein n=2 Tax=Brachyspira hampsonii TaxID=1287055 RepID=A0A2U4FP52_9SPIR|nr:hypothetical protein [Brachyspira hampsonii]EKV56923.1 hypothetical protein A966_07789 [Brachyspira hampsonii 30446]